jgi:multidrug efflux pump
MNLSALFIHRPVATTLLTVGITLVGGVAFFLLPVSPLPQIDYPTISVLASMAGASPETMASSVATPLERHLGQIADVSEMTSGSSLGQSRITLQFGLNRNIDGAARDVQAAINAARTDLPTSLRNNPIYRKVNPADSPIMVLSMTSSTLTPGQIYDAAASVLQQKLSQVDGIGQVTLGGSSLPAVRVELNPHALANYGIGLEDIRAALASANANSPKGAIEDGGRRYQIYTNDQALRADQYRSLVVAYRNGAAIRLSDVADVVDSVEDLRNRGLADGLPSILVLLYRQPGANIISTVDRVSELLPRLRAEISSDIDLKVATERTATIRASLHDVERTLIISVSLVVLVVFLFLRDARATLIPGVVVPVSLIGTFGVMYLLGYSLDNLSLMALTIGTGFVVDDAIVVLENVNRHIEAGVSRVRAAMMGAREVGFTVLSMSLSLVAVFIPILLMGGITGRLFREFAVTLSVAILISLAVSLSTTPMMCAHLLRYRPLGERSAAFQFSERCFLATRDFYARTLELALRHSRLTMLTLLATVISNGYLFSIVPKGFFPQQDTGRVVGSMQADQSASFQLMSEKLAQFIDIVRSDPAVETAIGFVGGGFGGEVIIALKPRSERVLSVDQVIGRLRAKLATVPGAALYLQPIQDIRMGGRSSNALYQFTLQSDSLDELRVWTLRLSEALRRKPGLADVNADQQEKGLETSLVIDRSTAARLHVTTSQIDNTLYDAFGQRQVSTIYTPLNQYHVVMEVGPQYWQGPEILNELFISTAGGGVGGTQATNAVAGTTGNIKSNRAILSVTADTARNQQTNQLAVSGRGNASTGSAVSTSKETMIPLAAFSHYESGTTRLAVNHQGHFAAATISFNLPSDKSLSDAVEVFTQTMQEIGVPISVHGSFQGTARAFQDSLDNQPLLLLAALVTVYIVLGVLYESTIHPITILSTLPSAGVGAVLALLACGTEFSIIALIGVILLIGIVKKNAIMMVDCALAIERGKGVETRLAIREACLQRFRPIVMTTLVAILGALPLALGTGEGSEMRRPLGISIVGGLIVSQVLTLYTTPVIYLYLDQFSLWVKKIWQKGAVPCRKT